MIQKVDRKYILSNYLLSSQSHVIQNEPINFVFVESTKSIKPHKKG